MSDTIDRRVVEMEFDNKQFEENVQTSVKSLEELKKNLDLEEAAKGLESLQRTGKHFDLDNVSDAAEAVTSKFSLMGTIGDQVIRRLTDSILNFVTSIRQHLKSSSIMAGLQEYETQMNSVQTILSNTKDEMRSLGFDTSESIGRINERLDELNLYADKTIYNFTQMTESIGRFTAAGVDLDTSTISIQGIANMAALSGANAEQASRAMYMYSQAVSTGVMRMYQWNSITSAGMGGESMQKAFLRTAKAMNKVVEVSEEVVEKGKKVRKTVKKTVADLVEEKGFRESLSYGWLTDDVMTKTFEHYSYDFDAMAQEELEFWKKLGVNTEKGTEVYNKAVEHAKLRTITGLVAEGHTMEDAAEIVEEAEMAFDAATKVKTFTQLIDTLKEAMQSGWTMTWRYLIGDFEEAKELFTGLSDFFGDLIGESADARNAIFEEWHDKGGRDTLFNNNPEKGPLGALWNLIYGLQNMINAVKEGLSGLGSGFNGNKLLSITKSIQKATAKFKEWTENAENMDKIRRIVAGIASIFTVLKMAVGYVWRGFKGLFGVFTSAASKSGGILDFFASIGDWLSSLPEKIKNSKTLQRFLTSLSGVVTSVASTIVSAAKTVWGWITKLWEYLKGSGVFSAVFGAISSFFGAIPGYLKKASTWFSELGARVKSSKVFATLSSGFEAFKAQVPVALSKLKDWVAGIINYVKTSGALQKAWKNIKSFFQPAVNVIIKFIGKLKTAIKNFFSADTSKDANLFEKIKTRFKAFAEAFKGGASSIKESIPKVWDKIKAWFKTFFTQTLPNFFSSDAFTNLIDSIKNMWEKLKNLLKKIFVVSGPLQSFVGDTLGAVFKTLYETIIKPICETIKVGDWKKVIGILGAVFVGLKALSAFKSLKNIGSGFTSLAKGFQSIAEGGINITKTTKTMIKKKDTIGTTLLKVAAAFALIVGSIWLISKMGDENVVKGLAVLGIIAAELLAVCLMFKLVKVDGDSFLKMSAGLLVITAAVWLLGTMESEKALKGVIALGAIMTEIVVMSRLAGTSKGAMNGLIKMAIATLLLTFAVKKLAGLDYGHLAAGVIALGGIMAGIITVAQFTGGKKISGLILMAIAINLLVVAVRRLAKLKLDKMIAGVTGLSVLMVAFGAMALMTKHVNLKSVIAPLLMFAGIIGVFVLAFKEIEGFDSGAVLEFAASLSLTMLSLSLAMVIISAIPIVGALSGLASFAILIAGIGAIAVGLGYLATEWEDFGPLIEKGGEIMASIGHALGAFFGNIVSGFVEGMDLPQIGTDLSDFMNNASDFIDGATKITPATMNGVGYLAAAVMAIGKAEFMNALVELFTGENPIISFSKDLVKLGMGLVGFGLAIMPLNALPEGLMEKGVEFATGLSDIAAKLQPKNGVSLVAMLMGISGFESFADDMTTLGDGLVNFCTAVNGLDNEDFDQEKLNAIVAIGQGIAGIESGLTEKGGMLQGFKGTKSLLDFATEIPEFSSGMNTFITEARKLTFNPHEGSTDMLKIDAVIAFAKKMAELENSLTSKGGALQGLTGTKSLADFASGFTPFAEGISDFITDIRDNLTDFDPTEGSGDMILIDRVIAIATALAKLEQSVQAQGGFVDDFLGVQSLATFSEGFTPFAAGISTFITDIRDNLTDFDPSENGNDMKKINSVIAIATALAQLENTLNPTGGTLQKWTGVKSLANLGVEIESVGKNLQSFYTSVKDVDPDSGEDAVSILEPIQTFIDSLDPSGSIWDDLEDFFGSGSKFWTLSSYVGSMRELGESLQAFADGVKQVSTDDIDYGAEVFGVFQGFMDGLDLSGSVWEKWDSFWNGDKFSTVKAVGAAMGDLGNNLAAFGAGVKDIDRVEQDFEGAKRVITAFDTFYETLFTDSTLTDDDPTNDHNWIFDSADLINKLGSALVDYAVQFAAFRETFEREGETNEDLISMGEFIEHMASFFSSIGSLQGFDPVKTLADLQTFFNAFQYLVLPDLNTENLQSMSELLDGLISVTDKVNQQSGYIAKGGAEAARAQFSSWSTAGKYLGSGLANGIASMAETIKNAARNAASGAVNAIQITWSIHSPSRVGKDLGRYFDLGIANGLSQYSKVVTGTADDMSQSVVDSAQTMLRGTDGSIFDNIDPNPTIRPVMDLSNVQNGVSSINGMMRTAGKQTASLFGGRSLAMSAGSLSLDAGRMTGSFNDRNIVSTLNKLQDKVVAMGDRVGNMQLVLDSGALVGATSSMMDVQLGSLSSMRERAN